VKKVTRAISNSSIILKLKTIALLSVDYQRDFVIFAIILIKGRYIYVRDVALDKTVFFI
jgi:hypothetical protein